MKNNDAVEMASKTDTGHPDRELSKVDDQPKVKLSDELRVKMTISEILNETDTTNYDDLQEACEMIWRIALAYRPAESQLCDCEPDKHSQDCPTYVKWVMDTQRRRAESQGAGDDRQRIFNALHSMITDDVTPESFWPPFSVWYINEFRKEIMNAACPDEPFIDAGEGK